MIFLICCGWAASGVLGYWLTRRNFICHKFTWLNSVKVFWLAVGALLGPVLAITGLVLLLGDLRGKADLGWFDRPSRW